MIKKLIKKYLPDHKSIKENKTLQSLGTLLHHPNLWHLNKYSASMGFSVGLFTALIPIPGQMLMAAILAVWLKGNLPLSVALVWLSNPFTSPLIAYLCYKVGAILLHRPEYQFKFELTTNWVIENFYSIGIPFFVGSIVVAFLVAIISNIGVRIAWRFSTILLWKKRALKRKNKP